MTRSPFSRTLALFAVTLLAACSHATRNASTGTPPEASAQRSPAAMARADSGRPHYTDADVHFMSGMIGHHAQALVMAGWAPSHGANPSVSVLCERIIVSQRDEIGSMQRWLRERSLPVPDADASHAMMNMPGMQSMMMPGMLTPEQMSQLDRARGTEFDRLFLTFMIQHHQGAVTMVSQLMGSEGAAQDDTVFKFAADVNVDQTTEIDRMTLMLGNLPGGR